MPKFPKLFVSHDTISRLGGRCGLVRMCIAFHMKMAWYGRRLYFILLGNGLRADGAWQDETWESLQEFADSNVDLASLEGCFVCLYYPTHFLTLHRLDMSGLCALVIINRPNLSFSVKTQCK